MHVNQVKGRGVLFRATRHFLSQKFVQNNSLQQSFATKQQTVQIKTLTILLNHTSHLSATNFITSEHLQT